MSYPINQVILGVSDARDYLYIAQGQSPYPQAVDLSGNAYEVEDQAQWGTCGPNMALAWEEARAKREGAVMDLSRLYTYRRAREVTATIPPDAEGVVLRDMFRAMRHYGAPPESLWPYEAQYLTDPIPASVDAAASLSKLDRFEALFNPRVGPANQSQRVELIKDALNQGLWVMIGLAVTNDIRLMTGPWRTHQYRGISPTIPTIGGHAVVIVGYDDTVGKFKFLNSWGAGWGDNGFGGLPYSVVTEFQFEAWVSRKFASFYDREPAGIRCEWLNQFSIRARIVPPVSRIGETVKLWIGVKSPQGQWFYSPSQNNFLPFPENGVVPHFSEIALTDTYEDIWVAREYDFIIGGPTGQGLKPYGGWDVYVAYGQTQQAWTGQMICTIPQFD